SQISCIKAAYEDLKLQILSNPSPEIGHSETDSTDSSSLDIEECSAEEIPESIDSQKIAETLSMPTIKKREGKKEEQKEEGKREGKKEEGKREGKSAVKKEKELDSASSQTGEWHKVSKNKRRRAQRGR
ncbi:unnamed protein product, partial [marine sediment metagenome]